MWEHVDWSKRGRHMMRNHGIAPRVAEDALSDADRLVINPDYNSLSGRSVRIIGYSVVADDLITVIVMEDEGVEYGVNGWRANEKDRLLYAEHNEGYDDE